VSERLPEKPNSVAARRILPVLGFVFGVCGLVWGHASDARGQVADEAVYTAVATGTTGAVSASMSAPASKLLFLCGFDVSAIGGTADVGPITVTGLTGGTFTYHLASSAGGVTLNRSFSPCIPASAVNTAIVVATTADGTASAVDVNVWGVAR
jgi:hypothetical protein